MTGSPFVTANPSLGIAALKEKALADIRWQPVQWQAMVSSGAAEILSRTCPQRHPPSQGKFAFFMIPSFPSRHHEVATQRMAATNPKRPAGKPQRSTARRSLATPSAVDAFEEVPRQLGNAQCKFKPTNYFLPFWSTTLRSNFPGDSS